MGVVKSCCAMVFIFFVMLQSGYAGEIFPLQTESELQGFDILVKGHEREVELASSMATGDFNGDNIMDLAVGSQRSASVRGKDEAGAVSIFFGGETIKNLPQMLKSVEDGLENVLIRGSVEDEYVGEFLTSGDLNHDGIDDLVIAAQQVIDTGMPVTPENSKIYVVYGSSSFSGTITLSSDADVTIQRSDSMHAQDIVVGDVNNDGRDDLLISDILTDSPTHAPTAPLKDDGMRRGINGAVYLISGGPLPPAIDPALNSDAVFMREAGEEVFQAMSLAIGDFNGDGINDIAFGAPGEDNATESLKEAGRTHILLGEQGKILEGIRDIDADVHVVISGAYEGDETGGTLTVGDVNADGMDDLVIGAPRSGWGEAGTTGKGVVQVVLGESAMAPAMDLFSDADITLKISSAASRIGFMTGYDVLAEDINGDGVDDLVISTPGAFTGLGNNGRIDVVFGGNSIGHAYTLDLDADISIVAPEAGTGDYLADSKMGQAIAVGDFNGDNRPDIVAGTPWGEGFDGYTGSGWFGIIFDPQKKSEQKTCIPFSQTLDLQVPNFQFGDVFISVTFWYMESVNFRIDTQSLDFPSIGAADDTYQPITLNEDFSITIPCADLMGSQVGFNLIPSDETFMNWEVDLATFREL